MASEPDVEKSVRFCPQCGTRAVPGNAFCSQCGKSLSGDTGSDSAQKVQPDNDAGTLTSAKRMSPTRWAIVVGLLACAVGVVLPWYSSLLLSVTGINTGDGQFFAGVLVVAALIGWWRLVRTNRINGTLLFLLWGGMFALAIYEMVNVSTIFTASTMGSGLYVCAIGSAVGTVATIIDMGWSNDPLAALAAGGLVLLALAGAAFGGHQHGTNIDNSLDAVLRSGSSNVSGLGSSHSSGSGSSGNSGSGITGSGATSTPGGGLTFTFTISQHDWSQIVALVNSPNQNINYHYSSGEDFLRAYLCEDADQGPGNQDASGFLAPLPVEVGTSGGAVVFRVTLNASQVAASDHQLQLNKCSSQNNPNGAPLGTIQQDYANSNDDFDINDNITVDGGTSTGQGSLNSGSTGSSGNSGTANSGSTGNT